MPQEEETVSFDEALSELRLKEEELKRLVSEGEIRAFRDGETMRLRKQDVADLRTQLSGGEVVDLGGLDEELVFDDDQETGMATEEISEADTILEDDVEDVGELELDEDEEVSTAAPVRRAATVATVPAAEADDNWPVWVLFGAVATSAVLVLFVLPVCISLSTGNASGWAKSLAGMFSGN